MKREEKQFEIGLIEMNFLKKKVYSHLVILAVKIMRHTENNFDDYTNNIGIRYTHIILKLITY